MDIASPLEGSDPDQVLLADAGDQLSEGTTPGYQKLMAPKFIVIIATKTTTLTAIIIIIAIIIVVVVVIIKKLVSSWFEVIN